jgi:hypothetical protein
VTEQVLHELNDQVAGKLVVSMVAGWSIGRIMDLAGAASCRVIRAMPNTPALVKEGVTALSYGAGVREEEAALVRRLFEAVGKVVLVEERLMDAVTRAFDDRARARAFDDRGRLRRRSENGVATRGGRPIGRANGSGSGAQPGPSTTGVDRPGLCGIVWCRRAARRSPACTASNGPVCGLR